VATHIDLDGFDSDYTCAAYPACVGDQARDPLGKVVRDVWIEWAHQQPVASTKPHWLTPYEELAEADKEDDRRIGERLFALGREAERDAMRAEVVADSTKPLRPSTDETRGDRR
jgi:hypothetical protein